MGKTTFLSSVVVKIIEELTDGLIILNQDKEVLFCNEVFLRMTGWRSKDILTRESAFVHYLPLNETDGEEREILLPDPPGDQRMFTVSSFRMISLLN